MTAPAMATARTAARLTRCWKASTPPSSTPISPGKRKPTKAEDSRAGRAKTTARAAHPDSARTWSARWLTAGPASDGGRHPHHRLVEHGPARGPRELGVPEGEQ